MPKKIEIQWNGATFYKFGDKIGIVKNDRSDNK